MQQPVQITFKEMEHSDAVETRVRQQVDKLEQMRGDITSCHVVIEAADRHSHRGDVAFRDAFRAARRQLQDSIDKRRGRVKRHGFE